MGSLSALESVVVTEQRQMRSERRLYFVLVSPRLPRGRPGKKDVGKKQPEYQETKTKVKCE